MLINGCLRNLHLATIGDDPVWQSILTAGKLEPRCMGGRMG